MIFIYTPKLYHLRKLPIKYIVKNEYDLHLSAEEEKQFTISQQDNQLFRQIRIITNDGSEFNKWIVFVNCKGLTDKEEAINRMIHEGFKINDELFVLSERSASMTRNSILSFVNAEIIDELNERVLSGARIKKTVLSKYYAYRGLMLSSCHCLDGWYPKVIVVPDKTVTMKNQHIKELYDMETDFVNSEGETIHWKQKDVKEVCVDLEKINLFDGCGIHHPDITDYVKHRLQIRERPTSLLLRMPYIKGVTHEMDYISFFEQHGIKEITDIWGVKHSVTYDSEPMFILTESMYKGYKYYKQNNDYSDWQYYWQMFRKYNHCIGITKWNFSKEREPVYTRGNYQILQDLDMEYDDFVFLAEYSMEWADKIMHRDPLSTFCFLGLMHDNHKTLNGYCKAMLKNPEMRNEETISQYVKKSLSKYRDELKCGKLWLRGSFKFLAPDLVALMEHIGGLEVKGCLEADEFYAHDIFGDMHGERSIERNPHICSSEHVILNAVTNDKTEWLKHLDNVCVINSKGIIPQRLQGADFDGDLVLVIDNKLYSTGVHRDAIPVIDVDDKITVQDEEDNSENRAKIVLRTMKNMIGEFSNYSSAYHNKKAHDKEQRKKYDKYIDIIAVATGKSID